MLWNLQHNTFCAISSLFSTKKSSCLKYYIIEVWHILQLSVSIWPLDVRKEVRDVNRLYDPLSNTIEVSLEVRDVSNNKGPQSIDSGLWRVFEKDVCIYLWDDYYNKN